jgi:hypothetical protein
VEEGGEGRRSSTMGDDGEQFLKDSPTWTNGSEFTITSAASGEASSCGFMQFKGRIFTGIQDSKEMNCLAKYVLYVRPHSTSCFH